MAETENLVKRLSNAADEMDENDYSFDAADDMGLLENDFREAANTITTLQQRNEALEHSLRKLVHGVKRFAEERPLRKELKEMLDSSERELLNTTDSSNE